MYYWGLHGFSCFHLLANFNRETCQFHWMRSFSRHSHNQFDPFQKNLEGLMMVHFQRTYGEVRSVPAIGNCSAAAPTFGPILTPQTWKLSTCPWPAWPEPVTCETETGFEHAAGSQEPGRSGRSGSWDMARMHRLTTPPRHLRSNHGSTFVLGFPQDM